jgi:hypothetical protein
MGANVIYSAPTFCRLDDNFMKIHENPLTGVKTLCSTEQKTYYRAGQSMAMTPALIKQLEIGHEQIEHTTRGKPLFNNCKHIRTRGINIPFMFSVCYSGTTHSTFDYRRYTFPAGYTLNSLGVYSEVPWGAVEDMRRRAWWEMQPRFETEVQLLNFIYELKDFKQIARHFMRFESSKLGVQLHQFWKKLRRVSSHTSKTKLAGKTLSGLTRTAAEARLVNEFAIKPLISDISAMFTTIASVLERLQQEFAGKGVLHSFRHYTEDIHNTKVGSYGTRYYSPRYLGVEDAARFTATMQYSYRYKLRKGWDLMKAALGLEFTAEVLWNMIPFSFLVDYVYKIGDALHRMRLDPNVDMRLLQYCESILHTTKAGYLIDRAHPTLKAFYSPYEESEEDTTPILVSGYERKAYRRRVVSPNVGTATPLAKMPSSGQLWNFAALVRCFF